MFVGINMFWALLKLKTLNESESGPKHIYAHEHKLYCYSKNNNGPNTDPCGIPHGVTVMDGGRGHRLIQLKPLHGAPSTAGERVGHFVRNCSMLTQTLFALSGYFSATWRPALPLFKCFSPFYVFLFFFCFSLLFLAFLCKKISCECLSHNHPVKQLERRKADPLPKNGFQGNHSRCPSRCYLSRHQFLRGGDLGLHRSYWEFILSQHFIVKRMRFCCTSSVRSKSPILSCFLGAISCGNMTFIQFPTEAFFPKSNSCLD